MRGRGKRHTNTTRENRRKEEEEYEEKLFLVPKPNLESVIYEFAKFAKRKMTYHFEFRHWNEPVQFSFSHISLINCYIYFMNVVMNK